MTDTGAIEAAVEAVIAQNPDKAEQARAKPTMAGWFVGQVMKATGGKANPQSVNALVKAKLASSDARSSRQVVSGATSYLAPRRIWRHVVSGVTSRSAWELA